MYVIYDGPSSQRQEHVLSSFSLLSIFSLVGFPKILQSDNGTEFVNNVVETLTEIMTVEHRIITPYNPRVNGAAEKWEASSPKHC
jgi:hypothetical protein